MTLDRRSLLGLIGAGAATPAVAKSANTGKVAFLHGVASGDPGSHSAVFWTRVTPEAGAGGDVAVTLEVVRDDAFRDVVRRVSNWERAALGGVERAGLKHGGTVAQRHGGLPCPPPVSP